MVRREFVVILALFLIVSTTNAIGISASPPFINVFSDDNFTVAVSFSFQNAASASIRANFDNSSLNLIGPAEIITLGHGTFAGIFNYSFQAISDNSSIISFELNDSNQTVSAQTNVQITPRHIGLSVDKEIVYVNAGNSFALTATADSVNSNNVWLNFSYDSAYLDTTEQNNIFIGSGTVTKEKTISFTAKNPENLGNQTITFSLCSDKSCVTKEVKVVVKAFSLFASAEENKIKPGDTFSITYTIKNVNNGAGNLNFDFDKNWFEMLGSPSKTVMQDNSITETAYFKMKSEGKVCPSQKFALTLTAGNQSITKEVVISLAPTIFAEQMNEKIVSFGESFESELNIFYFGFENGKIEVDYPQNLKFNKEEISLNGCDSKQIKFKFEAKDEEQEYSLGNIDFVFKEGAEVAKTIVQKIVLVKTNPELLTLCNMDNTLNSKGGENTIQNKCNPVIGPPNKCPASYEYNPSTKKCEKHPPVEIICGIGVYNETTDLCEYRPNVSVICPIGEYNETLDLCVYAPNQQIVCETGVYNATLNLCVYYPNLSIVCPPNATCPGNKILLCHKPGTTAEAEMCVSPSAVQAHLGHGDFLGTCLTTCPVIINICPPNYTFNVSTRMCERYPQTTIVCPQGTYNATLGMCVVIANTTFVCTMPGAHYDNVTGTCIYNPETVPICEKGIYNETTGTCQYYPASEILCGNGTYNSVTDRCEIFPPTDIICTNGTYNTTTGKCEWYPQSVTICPAGFEYDAAMHACVDYPNTTHVCPAGSQYDSASGMCVIYVTEIICDNPNATYSNGTCIITLASSVQCDMPGAVYANGVCTYNASTTIICDEGDYNPYTGLCEVYPDTDIICDNGTYNLSTGRCEWYPANITICPDGFEYDFVRQACVIYPNTSYICTDGGEYDFGTGQCVVNITETLCDNPNATYSNGTCSIIVNSSIQCDKPGAVYNDGVCTYTVASQPVYGGGGGSYTYTPQTTALCSKGEYNSTLGLCVYKPETNIQCEKGEYNPETDKCDYSPEPTVKTSKLVVELNEVFALTADIYNDFDESIQIKDSDLIVSDSSAIRILSSSLGISNLAPGESGRLSYLVKFEKPGDYNATLNIKYGDNEIKKPYLITVKPVQSSLSGMFFTETTPLPISIALVLAGITGILATIIVKGIKLKEEFK